MAYQFTIPSEPKASKATSKHLLERHRRARINKSLNELKHLVHSSLHYDDPQTYQEKVRERMDKADILDLTVQFLRENKQAANSGTIAERSSNEYLQADSRLYVTPPPPNLLPFGYPRIVDPNSEHMYLSFLNSRTLLPCDVLGVLPYLDTSGSPSLVPLPANHITGNLLPLNNTSQNDDLKFLNDLWRPW